MVHSPQPRLREGQTETESERARGEGAREREKKGMEGRNVQLEAPAARSGSEAHPQRILGWRLKTSRTQPNSQPHITHTAPSFLPFTPSPSLPLPHISLAALQTKEEAKERKKPRNLPPLCVWRRRRGEVQGRGSCLRRRRGKGGRREAAPAPDPGARASCAAPRPGCTAAPTRPRSAGAATRRYTAPTSWWRATRARSCAGAARAPRRGAPRARASAPPPPSATAASAAARALWAWAPATRRWAAAAATKKRTTTTTAATMTTRWSLRTTRTTTRRRRRKGRGRTRSCRGRRRPRRRRRPSPVPRPAAAGRPPPTAPAPQIAQRKTCRAPPRSRACATTCRQRTTAAAATRPPPPGTVAGSSPPPATGRDHPQISSALGRRNPGAALRRGIAPTRALAEMTLPEAGNM